MADSQPTQEAGGMEDRSAREGGRKTGQPGREGEREGDWADRNNCNREMSSYQAGCHTSGHCQTEG